MCVCMCVGVCVFVCVCMSVCSHDRDNRQLTATGRVEVIIVSQTLPVAPRATGEHSGAAGGQLLTVGGA